MNEITRIHLGREAYTISVEAHAQLKKYLAEIEKKVGDKEVLREVELRMSELLAERGVTSEKVILPEDVRFLQQQLGSPKDFGSEDDDGTPADTADKTEKRLFRDTDHAMVAGVSAGMASYFGIDPVIIRIIFVVLAFLGGGVGLVVYVILWLIVPPAETTSEKLQMQGKAVTLDALKNSVSKADIAGAAKRGGHTIAPIINRLFRLCIVALGVMFAALGVVLALSVAVLGAYTVLHGGQYSPVQIFPVGLQEHVLVWLAMSLVMILSVFLILIGVATFKRTWPIRGWATGLLAGLFLLAAVASTALLVDIVPRVKQRYDASMHTTAVANIQPFSKIVAAGDVDVELITSPDYAVNLHYFDHPDLSKVTVHTENGTLYIDAKDFVNEDNCHMLCFTPDSIMTVQVHTPNPERNVEGSGGAEIFSQAQN